VGIIQRFPDLLTNQMKIFFVKYNDPIFIKLEKLDIMLALVDAATVDICLSEFLAQAPPPGRGVGPNTDPLTSFLAPPVFGYHERPTSGFRFASVSRLARRPVHCVKFIFEFRSPAKNPNRQQSLSPRRGPFSELSSLVLF